MRDEETMKRKLSYRFHDHHVKQIQQILQMIISNCIKPNKNPT